MSLPPSAQSAVFSIREALAKEITQYLQEIKALQQKESKLQRHIADKFDEIADIKRKIQELVKVEAESKAEITKHIDMLSWLIESIDEVVQKLKDAMLENAERAVLENIGLLQDVLNDLQEVVLPLHECTKITKPVELENTIESIAQTLLIFSEGVDQSIESVTILIRKANLESVSDSSVEFDGFINDIHQIFETFNTILQRLKLTNSIKKYIDLELIYQECNRILDEIGQIHEQKAKVEAQKGLKEIELDDLNKFGLKRDLATLHNYKAIHNQRMNTLSQVFLKTQQEQIDALEKLDIIQLEKTNVRSFFEALSDEMVDNQDRATETYNLMYFALDQIHSEIPFIKIDLQNASELAIHGVTQEFSKQMKAFGKMVGIIQKVQQLDTTAKKKANMNEIYKKAIEYLLDLQKTFNEITNRVRASNVNSIQDSFVKFDEFVKMFKEKFYIIQETVGAFTLSTSEQLILDLQKLYEDQIEYRQRYLQKHGHFLLYEIQLQAFDKINQDIDKNTRIYVKDDTKLRKLVRIEKSSLPLIDNGVIGRQKIQILWTITNGGIVPFQNLHIIEEMSPTKQILEESHSYTRDSSKNVAKWIISTLEKRETQEIRYKLVDDYSIPLILGMQKKNISLIPQFAHRSVAKSILLTIIERNSNGAIILTNISEKVPVSSIYLEFDASASNSSWNTVNIAYLKPQQSFIKFYTYSTPKKFRPIRCAATIPCTMGLNLRRSLQNPREYEAEVIIRNDSDFLMYLLDYQFSSLDDLTSTIIESESKEIESILPRLDYRKSFSIQTSHDPPILVGKIHATIHLSYEYDDETHIDLGELNETPELMIGGDTEIQLTETPYPPITANVKTKKSTPIKSASASKAKSQTVSEEIDQTDGSTIKPIDEKTKLLAEIQAAESKLAQLKLLYIDQKDHRLKGIPATESVEKLLKEEKPIQERSKLAVSMGKVKGKSKKVTSQQQISPIVEKDTGENVPAKKPASSKVTKSVKSPPSQGIKKATRK